MHSLYNFFFLESFNLWRSLLMVTPYHQIKILISFWCRRGLNLKSLIQLLETLLVELIGNFNLKKKKRVKDYFIFFIYIILIKIFFSLIYT